MVLSAKDNELPAGTPIEKVIAALTDVDPDWETKAALHLLEIEPDAATAVVV